MVVPANGSDTTWAMKPLWTARTGMLPIPLERATD